MHAGDHTRGVGSLSPDEEHAVREPVDQGPPDGEIRLATASSTRCAGDRLVKSKSVCVMDENLMSRRPEFNASHEWMAYSHDWAGLRSSRGVIPRVLHGVTRATCDDVVLSHFPETNVGSCPHITIMPFAVTFGADGDTERSPSTGTSTNQP